MTRPDGFYADIATEREADQEKMLEAERSKAQRVRTAQLRNMFYQMTGKVSSSFPAEFRAFVAGFDYGYSSKQNETDRLKDKL